MGFKKVIGTVLKTAMGVAGIAVPGGSIVTKVFDALKGSNLSPEARAELESARLANEAEFKKMEYDYLAQAVKAANESFQAEASNGDKFTRRWRPTFGYMCTALIFWNYAVVPVAGMTPVEFPSALFQLFGAYLLVAVGARTWEKINFNGKGGAPAA